MTQLPGHKKALLLALTLVLLAALWGIVGMERTLAHGRPVLLKLAPHDPRSLMQGDYMRLRFALDGDIRKAHPGPRHDRRAPRYVYVQLDHEGRASFAGLGDLLPAPQGQLALRLRGNLNPSAGPNAFFFQEGKGEHYEQAKWGEMRVAPDGKTLLVALRGENLQLLGQQRR